MKSEATIKAMIQHAAKVREADAELTSVLKGLLGACQNKTGKDEIDVEHLELFVDPRSSSLSEDKIIAIGVSREDDDNNICAFCSDDSGGVEDYEMHFEDLLLETRVELVNGLIKLLDTQ